MLKIFKRMFDNEYKDLKRFGLIADAISELSDDMAKLSDKELAGYTDKFKKRLEKGETLEDILVDNSADIESEIKENLQNDKELQEWLRNLGVNIFVVFTKADKIARGKWRGTLMQYVKSGLFSLDVPIITSSVSGKISGIDVLQDFIISHIS